MKIQKFIIGLACVAMISPKISAEEMQSVVMSTNDTDAVVYGKEKKLSPPTMIDDTMYIQADVFIKNILDSKMKVKTVSIHEDVLTTEIVGITKTDGVVDEITQDLIARPNAITIATSDIAFVDEFELSLDETTAQQLTITTPSKEIPIGEVILQTGSKEIIVDGIARTIGSPVLIKNETIFLPLKSIAAIYGFEISFDNEQVIITNPVKGNTPPRMSFAFMKPSYIKGEKVLVQVYYEDDEDDEMGAQMWQVNDMAYTVTNAHDAICLLIEGDNTVSMKLKDEHGYWSDWYTTTVHLTHNYPPVILNFEPYKETYEVGEEIKFNVNILNEPHEDIKTYRYSYRQKDEINGHTIVDKPSYIYTEGEYIVKLILEDEIGNWSETVETTVVIEGGETMSEVETIFNRTAEGMTIANFVGANFRKLPDIGIEVTPHPGFLVMSNSPEIVHYNGILYQETLVGKGRVLVHHINGMADTADKKLLVVFENPSDKHIGGTVSNCIMKGPSPDVLFLGQTLLHEYFDQGTTHAIYIAPGRTQIFYDSSDKFWRNNMVISGMFDFNFPDEVIMSVVAIDVEQTEHDIDTLTYLNVDEHPRGTFDVADIDVKVSMKDVDRPVKFLLGEELDEWIVGWDALMNEVTENRGNFGIMYSIEVSAGDEDVAVFINPRGNMFRGAVQWNDDDPILAPKTGVFPDAKRGVFLGTVEANQTRVLKYMLPNGSAAPVLFGLVPESSWERM